MEWFKNHGQDCRKFLHDLEVRLLDAVERADTSRLKAISEDARKMADFVRGIASSPGTLYFPSPREFDDIAVNAEFSMTLERLDLLCRHK